MVAIATLFRAGQAFLVVTVGWNAAVGLLLTHNAREWPHRLQEVLLYCIYICELSCCFLGEGQVFVTIQNPIFQRCYIHT